MEAELPSLKSIFPECGFPEFLLSPDLSMLSLCPFVSYACAFIGGDGEGSGGLAFLTDSGEEDTKDWKSE